MRARAQELYALALAEADWSPESVCARTGWTHDELDETLLCLSELGLAAHFPSSRSGWAVHSPATAMAQLIEGSRRRTEELIQTITTAHTALSKVASEFQPVHMRQLAEARIEVAAQPSQIAAILDEAASTVTTEILSMHPSVPPELVHLFKADDRNREALSRGVRQRSIYLATAAAVPNVRAHLRTFVNDGGEIRTAATIPMKMIIVDHTLAVVPAFGLDEGAGDGMSGSAMVLRSPAMVAVLRQMFEHCWAAASDLFTDDVGAAPAARHREVVRLLASGLTDEAIGRKLGLSDRTVRRIVAELMQQIGADSRFQAGVKMVRLGWLDDDPALLDDVVGSTSTGRVGSSLSVSAASSTGRAADS
ncbi:LuxR C-terminal-related transcriptional regulator [Actinacidiphila glaucinigra]|uniref:LuxR C-terminal-related transcriptional regulator n=2 Tax=Kitasatosporales TaxID=85011 RepID=UPI0036CC24F6